MFISAIHRTRTLSFLFKTDFFLIQIINWFFSCERSFTKVHNLNLIATGSYKVILAFSLFLCYWTEHWYYGENSHQHSAIAKANAKVLSKIVELTLACIHRHGFYCSWMWLKLTTVLFSFSHKFLSKFNWYSCMEHTITNKI